MGSLTSNKHVARERFVQVLTNLHGYDVRRRINNSSNSYWIDQQNTLDNLHLLEKKVYERLIEFFFDSTYSCIALDDEMIGSKAMDVETKLVSNTKSVGEGPTCDCLCDTFFHFVLRMQIKTVSDSQLKNVEKLLDYLPTIDENTNSMLGPLLAYDQGYGKKLILGLLASRLQSDKHCQ
jgi:hypothetical protein